MKCLILAAGYATRLYPLTENFPKPLLEIKGKTILDWLIDDLEETNKINEYIVISNHKYIDHFTNWKSNHILNNKITVIDDGTVSNETRLGAVVDIDLAIKKLNIDEELMVMAGDNLLDFSLKSFIQYFEKKKDTCIMRYIEPNKEKIKKSACVIVNDNDLVLKMTEKPTEPESHWCCPAFYIYSKKAILEVSKALQEGYPKDAPGSFIAYLYQKQNVYAMEMKGHRFDIGNIESLEMAKENYHGIEIK